MATLHQLVKAGRQTQSMSNQLLASFVQAEDCCLYTEHLLSGQIVAASGQNIVVWQPVLNSDSAWRVHSSFKANHDITTIHLQRGMTLDA